MRHTAYQGNALLGPAVMGLPRVGQLRPLDRLLRRQHVGFQRHDDIDPTLVLQVPSRGPIATATLFQKEIASLQPRGLLQ